VTFSKTGQLADTQTLKNSTFDRRRRTSLREERGGKQQPTSNKSGGSREVGRVGGAKSTKSEFEDFATSEK